MQNRRSDTGKVADMMVGHHRLYRLPLASPGRRGELEQNASS